MKLESAPNIPKTEKPRKSLRPDQIERTESSERERNAMRASFMKSAKKVATFAAFIGGANGIGGCAAVQPRHESLAPLKTADYEPLEATAGFPKPEVMYKELADVEDPSQSIHRQRVRREAVHNAERLQTGNTELLGFERIEFDPKLFEEYLRVAFPRSWNRRANVSRVAIEPHLAKMSYPGFEEKTELAHCFVPEDGGAAEIEITSLFFKEQGVKNQGVFETIMPHELAHANDWGSSPDLSGLESLELNYLMLKAVQAEGRPKFLYVESIQSKERTEEAKVLSGRKTEFFAELVSNALTFREAGLENCKSWDEWTSRYAAHLRADLLADVTQSEHDAEMLKWYFSRVDPDFKPWEAAVKVDEVTGRIKYESRVKTLDTTFSRIPDPDLAETLVQSVRQLEPDVKQADLELQGKLLASERLRNAEFHQPQRLKKVDEHAGSVERELFMDWETWVAQIVNARMGKSAKGSTQVPEIVLDGEVKHFAEIWKGLPQHRKGALRSSMRAYAQMVLTAKAGSPKK